MTRSITVTLTRAEARNLIYAAYNVLDFSDAREAVFTHPSKERAVLLRARSKLTAALREAALAPTSPLD